MSMFERTERWTVQQRKEKKTAEEMITKHMYNIAQIGQNQHCGFCLLLSAYLRPIWEHRTGISPPLRVKVLQHKVKPFEAQFTDEPKSECERLPD